MAFRTLPLVFASLVAALPAWSQDAAEEAAAPEETAAEEEVTVAAATPDQPRSMSGMSILGNEEAPKALVIIPWKSSEIGDELGLSDNLDDDATPVDRDVFLRELEYYEIRKAE